MRLLTAALVVGLAALAGLGGARADDPEACAVPGYLLFSENSLNRVAAAVTKEKRLPITVIGTVSSMVPGRDGPTSPTRPGSRRRSRQGCRMSTLR